MGSLAKGAAKKVAQFLARKKDRVHVCTATWHKPETIHVELPLHKFSMLLSKICRQSTMSGSAFFRYTTKGCKVNRSVKECEDLRLRPLSGMITWFDCGIEPIGTHVATGKTNLQELYVSALYMQNVETGK